MGKTVWNIAAKGSRDGRWRKFVGAQGGVFAALRLFVAQALPPVRGCFGSPLRVHTIRAGKSALSKQSVKAK